MRSYRSMVAWQRAHELCIGTLRAADRHYHARGRVLFDQLKRAAISVEANIVEGYALWTMPQFRRHLVIAIGSAAEVECLLNIAQEADYLPSEACGPLLELANGTIRVLYGLLRRLRSQR